MVVQELIALLSKLAPEAVVTASDVYGERTFEITGATYDAHTVELTGEEP